MIAKIAALRGVWHVASYANLIAALYAGKRVKPAFQQKITVVGTAYEADVATGTRPPPPAVRIATQ